jgi:hypothetical protein
MSLDTPGPVQRVAGGEEALGQGGAREADRVLDAWRSLHPGLEHLVRGSERPSSEAEEGSRKRCEILAGIHETPREGIEPGEAGSLASQQEEGRADVPVDEAPGVERAKGSEGPHEDPREGEPVEGLASDHELRQGHAVEADAQVRPVRGAIRGDREETAEALGEARAQAKAAGPDGILAQRGPQTANEEGIPCPEVAGAPGRGDGVTEEQLDTAEVTDSCG